MARSKYLLAVGLAASVLTSLPAAAHWHQRCGFDRYGYLPPDFRGCAWYGRYEPVAPVPYLRAPVLDYPPPPNCYFDNGYDLRVRLVCREWAPYLPD